MVTERVFILQTPVLALISTFNNQSIHILNTLNNIIIIIMIIKPIITTTIIKSITPRLRAGRLRGAGPEARPPPSTGGHIYIYIYIHIYREERTIYV